MIPKQQSRQRLFRVFCVVGFVATIGIVGGVFVAGASVQSGATDLSVDISTQSMYVTQGDSVSLEVTIQNTGDQNSPAPVFDLEKLPSGWSVSSWSNENATYRSSTNEWLWTELQAGGEKELTIILQASDAAESFTATGELFDGYDNTAVGDTKLIIGAAPTSTGDSGGGGGGGGYYDNTDPTARTQPNVTIDAGTTLAFNGSNSTDNDELDSYDWDFNGDGNYERSGINVSKDYTTSGNYTVTLRVTDDYENTDTAQRTITVQTRNDGDENISSGTENGAVGSGNGGAATTPSQTTSAPTVANTESPDTAGRATTSAETTVGGSGPGFSIATGILAGVLGVILARRR